MKGFPRNDVSCASRAHVRAQSEANLRIPAHVTRCRLGAMRSPRRKRRRRSKRLNVIYTSDSQASPSFSGFKTADFTSDDEYISLSLVKRVINSKTGESGEKSSAPSVPPAIPGPSSPTVGGS